MNPANLGQDGNVQHDYAGAAYWYHQAADHGNAQAAYELAILYHEGLGVTADKEQSFQPLQKSAEANYVPAMPLLSDSYADQKTAVSTQRATYWATKAADAGDARGWLIPGFEYSAGNPGGDRPYWYKSAMQAYRKAADGGNCVAMIEIGELYAIGKGVPADKSAAANWNAKAESCQGGDLAILQQQISQYRARAAAAREPVINSMMGAIPAMPVVPKTAPPVARNGHGADSRFLANLAAEATVLLAITALLPDSPHGGNATPDDHILDASRRNLDNFSCTNSGGSINAFGSCSH